MPSVRQRVYTYLMLVAIPILSLMFINKSIINNEITNRDFKNIPIGTKLSLRCKISTANEYFIMPSIIWFNGVDKLYTLFGIQYDYWSIQTYEAKIKIKKNPERPFVPQDEFLIIGGPTLIDIDCNGKITYIIPLTDPPELTEIIISSYIDNHTGFLGNIGYVFETIYPKKITIKEFDKVMGCVNKIIYPDKEKNNVRRY